MPLADGGHALLGRRRVNLTFFRARRSYKKIGLHGVSLSNDSVEFHLKRVRTIDHLTKTLERIATNSSFPNFRVKRLGSEEVAQKFVFTVPADLHRRGVAPDIGLNFFRAPNQAHGIVFARIERPSIANTGREQDEGTNSELGSSHDNADFAIQLRCGNGVALMLEGKQALGAL